MKLSDETYNTIIVFLLILFIANIGISQSNHQERIKSDKAVIKSLDESTQTRKDNIEQMKKVEQEQKIMNALIKYKNNMDN